MSNLKGEFEASFGNYVPEDGADVRRMMLERMLEISLDRLIGEQMLEPYDLAAQMTCAVHVDPRDRRVQALVREVEVWQQARQDAEDNFDDPDEVSFDPQVDNIELEIDETVSGLADFFQAVKTAEGGNAYLAQVIACLAWAHKIPMMIPNLYSPTGQE